MSEYAVWKTSDSKKKMCMFSSLHQASEFVIDISGALKDKEFELTTSSDGKERLVGVFVNGKMISRDITAKTKKKPAAKKSN